MLIGLARVGWPAAGLVAAGRAFLLVNMYVQTSAALDKKVSVTLD